LCAQALKDYDEGLEKYIPVLMAMARIYWDRENYPMVCTRVCTCAWYRPPREHDPGS
jgi:hypothetical protein